MLIPEFQAEKEKSINQMLDRKKAIPYQSNFLIVSRHLELI